MKTATRIIVVAVFVFMVWPAAGNAGELGRRWCSPMGTWIGVNQTYEQEYLVVFYRLSIFNHYFDDGTGNFRFDLVEEFHGFHDTDYIPFFDSISHLDIRGLIGRRRAVEGADHG